MQQSKMMPHDIELEKVILGAMIVDSTGYYLANDTQQLESDDFYTSFHQQVYDAIRVLAEGSLKIDLITVIGELKKKASPNDHPEIMQNVFELTSRVASSANMDSWVLSLKEFSMRRKTIIAAHNAQKRAYSNEFDIFDTIQGVQSEISDITDKLSHQGANIDTLLGDIELSAMGQAKTSAIPTGIPSLDEKINGGIELEDFITIGGHPGQGKTALACNMCVSLLEQVLPFMFFSYEMTPKQLLLRIIASKAGVPFSKLKKGGLDEAELTRFAAIKKEIKQKSDLIKIVDCAGMSIDVLRAKAVTEKTKTPNLACFFVDYLQLIAPSAKVAKDDKNERVSNICYQLMALKKSIGVPCVVLSQLRKQSTNDLGKRPSNFELYGAQAIIACSTKIMFAHRPETYDILEFEDGETTANRAELLVTKNREGETGVTRVYYDAPILTFTDNAVEVQDDFAAMLNMRTEQRSTEFGSMPF